MPSPAQSAMDGDQTTRARVRARLQHRPYGPRNGKRTPDIGVDCGPDLVLIEVTSGRFTLPTLVEGDPEKAART